VETCCLSTPCLGSIGSRKFGGTDGLGVDICSGVYTVDINDINVYKMMDCTHEIVSLMGGMTMDFVIRKDVNQLDYDMYWCVNVKPILELHVQHGFTDRYWRYGGRRYEFGDLRLEGDLGKLQGELVLYSKGVKVAGNEPLYYGNYRPDGPQLAI
jgi:hypothetical protein